MNLKKLYIHDVLQIDGVSGKQSVVLGDDKLFDRFKEVWEVVQDFDCEIYLITLANGVEQEPEWVDYIKNIGDRVKFVCHGWDHIDYSKLSKEEAFDKIFEARKLIESTFNTQIDTFVPPQNKVSETLKEVVAALNMKMQVVGNCSVGRFLKNPYGRNRVDVHYWFPKDLENLKLYAEERPLRRPVYVIGAPRSGTTAYYNYLDSRRYDLVGLLEKENWWRKPNEHVQGRYLEIMSKVNMKGFLDKNCRNSLRIPRIVDMYPEAEFRHIIRDGRAVANSWRNYSVRTKKTDQTIEGAAYQWVHYVSNIYKNIPMMKYYTELRYEDLCDDIPQMESRDGKWKKQMTKEEIEIVTKIQKPWLERLEYI